MSDGGATDYVIVGAGAAGAVLAARLSERESTRVLLLEAGPDLRWADCPQSMHSVNPAAVIVGADTVDFRWPKLKAARTASQPHLPFWRGRGLGGSTAINGMFAVRPEPADLDDWVAAGCKGWSWEETLPWFRHLEDDADFGDAPYHGRGGPYAVWRPPLEQWGTLDLALREAALDAGHPWCEDHNAPHSTGVSPYAASVRGSVRVSTNDAYLEPARDRRNLTIVGDALVDRVVVAGGQAVAVEYLRSGERHRAEAGEIVLCGGAVHSPAVLLRSGIGPAASMPRFGIDVVHPLDGVGMNLSDHPAVMVMVLGPPDDSWAAASGRHGSCYVRYSSGMERAGGNDMALVPLTYPANLLPGMPSSGAIGVSVWQPSSKGHLELASTDPADDPVVHETMLSAPSDIERMRDGLRRVIDMLAHPAVKGLGESWLIGRLGDMTLRPLRGSVTDDELDHLASDSASDLQHIVGTCRMGDPSDPQTVVDPSGRVVGLRGLRVIDASVFPTCPRANTALTTIMVAEKLAGEMTGSGPRAW